MYDGWIGAKIPGGIEGKFIIALIDWLRDVLYQYQPT